MIPSVVKNPSSLKLSKSLSPVIQGKMREVESEEDPKVETGVEEITEEYPELEPEEIHEEEKKTLKRKIDHEETESYKRTTSGAVFSLKNETYPSLFDECKEEIPGIKEVDFIYTEIFPRFPTFVLNNIG